MWESGDSGMPAFPIDMQIDITTLRWRKVGEGGGHRELVTEKQENPKLRKDRTQHKYEHVRYVLRRRKWHIRVESFLNSHLRL